VYVRKQLPSLCFCNSLNMYDSKSAASSPNVCMSMVGTPDYMAPEIILKSGHNFR
jgi:serine/threonine protein kinase